jgi:hypothetical protein
MCRYVASLRAEERAALVQTEPDTRRVTIFGDIDVNCYMGMYGQVKWVQVVQTNLS